MLYTTYCVVQDTYTRPQRGSPRQAMGSGVFSAGPPSGNSLSAELLMLRMCTDSPASQGPCRQTIRRRPGYLGLGSDRPLCWKKWVERSTGSEEKGGGGESVWHRKQSNGGSSETDDPVSGFAVLSAFPSLLRFPPLSVSVLGHPCSGR